jgi:hypothetical protein
VQKNHNAQKSDGHNRRSWVILPRRYRIATTPRSEIVGGDDRRSGIAAFLPGGDLGDKPGVTVDAAIEALACQTPISISTIFSQLACLRDVVELQAAQNAPGCVGREGLIERTGRMGQQVVEHHANALQVGISECR